MLYAMLIFQSEEVLDNFTDQEAQTSLAAHRALQDASKKAGHFRQASQLVHTSAATTVRRRNGKVTITDGPFAETKEMLIGLYVLECDDLEQAIAYAAQIPDCQTGAVEVRPIAYLEVKEGPAK